jgi:predicted NBD/HSP70 family sugar kinase
MQAGQLLDLAIACIGTLLVVIGGRISNDLHRLTEAVEDLKLSMATTAERVESHEKRLSRLEDAKA